MKTNNTENSNFLQKWLTEKGKESEPGSGPLGAVAQICWLGHPSQASDFPADSDCGPGQSEKQYRISQNHKQKQSIIVYGVTKLTLVGIFRDFTVLHGRKSVLCTHKKRKLLQVIENGAILI